jgi:hypothetical protein
LALLAGLYRKVIACFSRQSINAAQAWKAQRGDVDHAFWMYACPVHLLLGRDSFFLSNPAPVPISIEESIDIITSLNKHFSEMGCYFYVVNDVWFLGLDHDPKVLTTPIGIVKDKDIAHYLPQGEGASAWNKLQNEIQMLLFNHPVNQKREAQGQLIINSLWCYGLGAS